MNTQTIPTFEQFKQRLASIPTLMGASPVERPHLYLQPQEISGNDEALHQTEHYELPRYQISYPFFLRIHYCVYDKKCVATVSLLLAAPGQETIALVHIRFLLSPDGGMQVSRRVGDHPLAFSSHNELETVLSRIATFSGTITNIIMKD